MQFICRQSALSGTVAIPGSKSHTIRAVLLASLADGESTLINPLTSQDTEAAVHVYRQLGAEFQIEKSVWKIRGNGGYFTTPADILDVRNSGTTLRVALGSCSLLASGKVVITGDKQIQKRPCFPLVRSLNDLGAKVVSSKGNGCAPFTVQGRLKGGHTVIEAKTSQYVTSLLLCCPLADQNSTIDVPLLYEKPYVQMTLDWLKFQGIQIDYEDLSHFHIPGGQIVHPFTRKIPADFSTATFFLVAGALGSNSLICSGLDMNDPQSDKAVVTFLKDMGATVTINEDTIIVNSNRLDGIDIDMNDCPDALPMMAVAGCFAEGTTRLLNVPQARIKETDRISVMCHELRKLGAKIDELEDGLVIHSSSLQGAVVSGHGDHRVVMALAIAGMLIPGETRVNTAEAASVTFPEFKDDLQRIGGDIQLA